MTLNMKTLYLLRHAKSAWDDFAVPDFDRPLAPRGQRAAVALGDHLVASGAGAWPERVVCSPARRARETAERVVARLTPAPVIEQQEALYLSGWSAALAVVQRVPDSLRRVMVVMHNPDIQELALALIGSGDLALRRTLAERFPTGGLAVLGFSGLEWQRLAPKGGVLLDFVRPRDLTVS